MLLNSVARTFIQWFLIHPLRIRVVERASNTCSPSETVGLSRCLAGLVPFALRDNAFACSLFTH